MTGVNGKQMTIQLQLNVNSLKVFAFLMCKGTVREKAGHFFDFIFDR